MTLATAWWARLRQLRYPPEFRITPIRDIAGPLLELQRLAEEVRAGSLPGSSAPTAQATSEAVNDVGVRLLATVSTGLWRMRLRMIDRATGQPLEAARKAFRHLESIWDSLLEAGIEIQDHTGRRFDSGVPLKVLSFEIDAAVPFDTITETVRPTIYYRGAPIQVGEVIVSTPNE